MSRELRVSSQEHPEVLGSNEDSPATTIVSIEARVSPIPSPSDLGEYEHIVPGAGERILRMAEKEQDHRIQKETSAIRLGWAGLIVGSLVTILIFGGGIWLISNGRNWGVVNIIAGLSGLAGVFIYGTKPNFRFHQER